MDKITEAYKKGLDLSLIRENLKLSVEERFEKHMALQRFAEALREAKFLKNMTNYASLLSQLAANQVRFILVGGAAAIVHGASRLTQDVDIVYDRSDDNLARIVEALRSHHPYLRGAPEGLPFDWSITTLKHGLNFTLTRDLGAIDLLGEITGGGGYAKLVGKSSSIEAMGVTFLCLDLDALIETKKAAGRPKDLEAIAELQEIKRLKGG